MPLHFLFGGDEETGLWSHGREIYGNTWCSVRKHGLREKSKLYRRLTNTYCDNYEMKIYVSTKTHLPTTNIYYIAKPTFRETNIYSDYKMKI